ncbi:MAG: Mur ligase family protein [Clostridiales bacterium]|jgi:UDP-N-acetylmuramyl tripeptide synthase|nr:Mur ligase family protein [Clostridiales bacterium]
MKIRVFLAVSACRIAIKLLRLLGRGGTAIPGKIALKICPELLGYLAKDVKCVLITGTNGKTTSSRIIEEIFAKSGASYFANRSGANLINGITSIFIENSTLTGKPKKEYAVIECDEAASKEVCRLINPSVVLVTNVFRDQLDRYGEVTHTLENILIGIKNSPNAVICLNADCSLTASIATEIPNKVMFFGVDVPIYNDPVSEVSDAPHCIKCKHEYDYSYHTFGHLGGFYCPNCGYKRPETQVSVTEILDTGISSTTVRVSVFGDSEEIVINLPGGYNIYNAVGALAVSEAIGFKRETAKSAIATFSCGFGRMEQFDLGGHTARIILVKNPAGCNQVLNYLSSLSEKTVFVCCLNDNSADGRDISWIWDVNFEKLADMDEFIDEIYVSGIRSADMAVRLKYAGINESKLKIFDDYDSLIKAMEKQILPVVIMPTYSAMMDLRSKMSAAFGGKEFWE